MSMLWMAGLAAQQEKSVSQARAAASKAQGQAQSLSLRIQDLEHHVARLSLMNQALWELLRERAGLTDDDLAKRAREIDLRDGVEDGRITDTPLQCPTCGRVSNSKHWKCMYCGQLFERPVMG